MEHNMSKAIKEYIIGITVLVRVILFLSAAVIAIYKAVGM